MRGGGLALLLERWHSIRVGPRLGILLGTARQILVGTARRMLFRVRVQCRAPTAAVRGRRRAPPAAVGTARRILEAVARRHYWSACNSKTRSLQLARASCTHGGGVHTTYNRFTQPTAAYKSLVTSLSDRPGHSFVSLRQTRAQLCLSQTDPGTALSLSDRPGHSFVSLGQTRAQRAQRAQQATPAHRQTRRAGNGPKAARQARVSS
jgi:hypothetical protein